MDEMEPNVLSEYGEQRKKAMLDQLTQTMHRVHRRRQIVRRVSGGASMALIVILAAVFVRQDPGGQTDSAGSQSAVVSTVDNRLDAWIVHERPVSPGILVQTDESIVERLRADPPQRVVSISAVELLGALAELGRPAALVEMEGVPYIAGKVTDEQLGLRRSQRR